MNTTKRDYHWTPWKLTIDIPCIPVWMTSCSLMIVHSQQYSTQDFEDEHAVLQLAHLDMLDAREY